MRHAGYRLQNQSSKKPNQLFGIELFWMLLGSFRLNKLYFLNFCYNFVLLISEVDKNKNNDSKCCKYML